MAYVVYEVESKTIIYDARVIAFKTEAAAKACITRMIGNGKLRASDGEVDVAELDYFNKFIRNKKED